MSGHGEHNKIFRVGISGSYGGMNLGDEAILQSIVRELRSSLPVEITVFSLNPKDSLSRHDVESVMPQLNGCGDKVRPYLFSEGSPRSTCTEPPANSQSHCVGSALYPSPCSRVFTPNSPVLPSPLSPVSPLKFPNIWCLNCQIAHIWYCIAKGWKVRAITRFSRPVAAACHCRPVHRTPVLTFSFQPLVIYLVRLR
jgi:hypothetical protein